MADKFCTKSGDWNDATLWSPAGVPAATDNIIFDGDVVVTDSVGIGGNRDLGFPLIRVKNGAKVVLHCCRLYTEEIFGRVAAKLPTLLSAIKVRTERSENDNRTDEL